MKKPCELCRTRRAVKRLHDAPNPDADVCAPCGRDRLKLQVWNLYAQIYEVEREIKELEQRYEQR